MICFHTPRRSETLQVLDLLCQIEFWHIADPYWVCEVSDVQLWRCNQVVVTLTVTNYQFFPIMT